MIFSGDESVEFWNLINAVQDERTHDALYAIGCKLQELESLVRKVSSALGKILPPE